LFPQRTRLFTKDYILEIVDVDYGESFYYYTVHRRTTGEILTLGHERTYELAQRSAVRTLRELTGEDLSFERGDGAPAAS
jgi:hypothetical protein